MNEEQWLSGNDPKPMLEFLRGKASDRKLRLFKSACCRRIWHLLTEDRSRKAIEAVEAFSDGELSTESFEAASQDGRAAYYDLNEILRETGTSRMLQARLFAANAACGATYDAYPRYNIDACSYAVSTSESVGDAIGHSTDYISKYTVKKAEELKGHAVILRDIVGNPFRPVALGSSWLKWNDGTVVRLAQGVYDDRAFDLLPILTDALEEAGCLSEELLAHLRSNGPHVRGCWALDLILGKE
jgi:hypothetical protein